MLICMLSTMVLGPLTRMLRHRIGLGFGMVVLQGISTYTQYGGNVLSFLYGAKVRKLFH